MLEFANNRVWRVKQGSGMGLRHSGDLADLSMYSLCEKAWALSTVVATEYGINTYWRFRDNVFIIAADRRKFHAWFQIYRQRAACFLMECVEISYHHSTMLAVEVKTWDPK